MNEALSDHLKEQADAAERDWRAVNGRLRWWAAFNLVLCFSALALVVSHWWLREYDWPWLITQLSGSTLQVASMGIVLFLIRGARVRVRLHATLMLLLQRRLEVNLAALDRAMEKRMRGY